MSSTAAQDDIACTQLEMQTVDMYRLVLAGETFAHLNHLLPLQLATVISCCLRVRATDAD